MKQIVEYLLGKHSKVNYDYDANTYVLWEIDNNKLDDDAHLNIAITYKYEDRHMRLYSKLKGWCEFVLLSVKEIRKAFEHYVKQYELKNLMCTFRVDELTGASEEKIKDFIAKNNNRNYTLFCKIENEINVKLK